MIFLFYRVANNVLKCNINITNLKNVNCHWTKQTKRNFIGNTYEGTGKTTGVIVNKKGVEVICIDGITKNGFELTNGFRIVGSTIFFPHTILSWKIKNVNDVNEDSLALFTILQPKVDVLLLGYGGRGDISFDKMKELTLLLKKLKINYELMTTEDASATFNFCSLDKRYVAAALIPPSKVTRRLLFDEKHESVELNRLIES